MTDVLAQGDDRRPPPRRRPAALVLIAGVVVGGVLLARHADRHEPPGPSPRPPTASRIDVAPAAWQDPAGTAPAVALELFQATRRPGEGVWSYEIRTLRRDPITITAVSAALSGAGLVSASIDGVPTSDGDPRRVTTPAPVPSAGHALLTMRFRAGKGVCPSGGGPDRLQVYLRYHGRTAVVDAVLSPPGPDEFTDVDPACRPHSGPAPAADGWVVLARGVGTGNAGPVQISDDRAFMMICPRPARVRLYLGGPFPNLDPHTCRPKPVSMIFAVNRRYTVNLRVHAPLGLHWTLVTRLDRPVSRRGSPGRPALSRRRSPR